MRKLLIAGLALLLIPALALAGKTVTEGTNTLQVKASFDPAKASKSKKKLRPVEVTYDVVSGTTNDKRLPDLRSVKAYLGGAKFKFDAFPKCDETDAATNGDGECPNGSRVGSGTAVAEVHPPDDPNAKSDVAVDVILYNGTLDTDRDGNPSTTTRDGLIVYTEVAGTQAVFPFWAERRGTQLAFYNPAEDPEPNQEFSIGIKEIHLIIDKRSVRRDGRRIPFLGAPTECEGKWTVTHTNEHYTGQPLVAQHKVRCSEA